MGIWNPLQGYILSEINSAARFEAILPKQNKTQQN